MTTRDEAIENIMRTVVGKLAPELYQLNESQIERIHRIVESTVRATVRWGEAEVKTAYANGYSKGYITAMDESGEDE